MLQRYKWIAVAMFAIVLGLVVGMLMLPNRTRVAIYSRIFPLSHSSLRRLLSDPADHKTIKIGIPGPIDAIRETNLFLEGVEMAAAECNTAGILPIPLETVISDDKNRIADVLTVAGDYAKDTDVVAVVGHWGSDFSMAAAQIYENAGIVMLTPVSTNPQLTASNFRLVFRSAPTDNKIAVFLADYAYGQGYRNIVCLYSKDMTGIQVSHAFEKRASELGLRILDKRSISGDMEQLVEYYDGWRENGMDAVFIADIITRDKKLLEKLVEQDPYLPILATDAFDYNAPLLELGQTARSVHVVTFFNPGGQGGGYAEFSRRFEALYGKKPDYWALQGYDSVWLLVKAIREAGSLRAEDIAAVLRSPDAGLAGVSGAPILFDENGDAVYTQLYIKQVKYGAITYWSDRDGAR